MSCYAQLYRSEATNLGDLTAHEFHSGRLLGVCRLYTFKGSLRTFCTPLSAVAPCRVAGGYSWPRGNMTLIWSRIFWVALWLRLAAPSVAAHLDRVGQLSLSAASCHSPAVRFAS